MPTPPLLIDAHAPDLRSKVRDLLPVPGYCIFIDIVGSTAMKQRGIHDWISMIHNAFANAQTFLLLFQPLKGIGDELMYYIEEADLNSTRYSPLQLFDWLFQIATVQAPSFPPVKVVAGFCSSVYPMTFLEGSRDYYGLDIDRVARLKGPDLEPPVQEGEVIIDDVFYQRVSEHYNIIGNQGDFLSVESLTGPTVHKVKGISQMISIYRASRPTSRDSR
jgi:hypothetical protein